MISAAYHREHGSRLPSEAAGVARRTPVGKPTGLPSEGAPPVGSADPARHGGPAHAGPPDLPRFALLDGPSPLQQIPRFAAVVGGGADMWIKREDLLPLAFGGNKLRNLEFLVGAALADGRRHPRDDRPPLVDHARLTAAAGAIAGLGVHLVLSGPPLERPGPNQLLDELFGAVVHVSTTDSREERTATLERVVADLRATGHRPYVVPTGGSGPIGVVGSILAGLELADQQRVRSDIDRTSSSSRPRRAGRRPGCWSGSRWPASRPMSFGVAVGASGPRVS